MRTVCIFCGSKPGKGNKYNELAKSVATMLGHEGLDLVYGGGKIGLMGMVANTFLANGRAVTGIIPDFLSTKEVAHNELTELITVESMHVRKAKMYELSDAFITLPGGYGTLDELIEVTTWAQLGLHQKPIGLLNHDGYFTPLYEQLKMMVREGFLNEQNFSLILIADTAEELWAKMRTYQAPERKQWIQKEDL